MDNSKHKAVPHYIENIGIIDSYECSKCGKEVFFDSEDDIKTKWYKCPAHGLVSLVKTKERQKFDENQRELTKPLSLNKLKEILGSTIKEDDNNKLITFLAMLCTYTEEDQINIGFIAESSTGKSYIPSELSWYFPKQDIIKLGYVSPSAFFHDWGIPLPDPSDLEGKHKIIHIDLHQKILIFLDQPHNALLERLRPLTAHDEKNITVKITDRKQKSGLRTKTVVLEGYPTVIFCTAKTSMDEQEKTRLLLLSPEKTKDKVWESLILKIEKESNRETFHNRMEEDPQRVSLKNRVENIRLAKIKNVIIPEELREEIVREFKARHKYLQPRQMRDITRLLAIIKGNALMNYTQRDRVEDAIIVNQEDVQVGFKLYNTISDANELGLPPEIYNVYIKLLPKLDESEEYGITRKDFQKFYYTEFHKFIGSKKATEILKLLDTAGLLSEIPDQNDRRVLRYIPQGVGVYTEDIEDKLEFNDNTLLKYGKCTPTPESI